MPGNMLTTASMVQCMHGAPALLITSNTKVTAGGAPVLLESDVHVVTGCPFFAGPVYSPCVKIEWSAGASQVSVDGTKVLVQSSIGKCSNAAGAPQGIAIIATTQPLASAM